MNEYFVLTFHLNFLAELAEVKLNLIAKQYFTGIRAQSRLPEKPDRKSRHPQKYGAFLKAG